MGKTHGGWKLLPEGEAAFRFLLREYRRQAATRGLDFLISKDQFMALTKAQCFYCGREPASVIRRPELNGFYTYNGVDRVDSSQGYSTVNTVTCCNVCNRAKFTMTQKEFIDWLHQASDHLRTLQTTIV
jgi:hypothetical protein